MKTIAKMYWARVLLGGLAGLLSIAVGLAFGTIQRESMTDLNSLLNGITVALIVYLLSYYAFKAVFKGKVEKQQKFITMGIGVYFFTWIVTWVALYTILLGPP